MKDYFSKDRSRGHHVEARDSCESSDMDEESETSSNSELYA